jgi:hypothetical protein
MSRESNRVEFIFAAALECQAGERTAFLDEACAGDEQLRARVEALLKWHEEVGSFLERPAAESLDFDLYPFIDLAEVSPAEEETEAPAGLGFLKAPRRPGSLGRLGHYDVLDIVGRGGMGVVLRAFDEVLHRIVAVKVLAPELTRSMAARQRFLREARTAAAVTHDHIVTIHAVEEEGTVSYLVMQYVAGQSLQEYLERNSPLEIKEIVRIGLQIAQGLAAAHKQGLVHWDIKPSNILLENGSHRVKITDFGLARAIDDASITQSGTITGTPMFMSPEQAQGEVLDHRSDLFSLGSVLYTLAAGRPPFRAANTLAVLKRVCEDRPRPVQEINPDLPGWLAALIGRLMAKDPAERCQSAAEVADLLAQHLPLMRPATAPTKETVAMPAARPRRGSSSRVWRFLVVGVLLAAGALAGFLAWHRLAGPAGQKSGPDPGVPAPQPASHPGPPRKPADPAKLSQ